MEKKDAIMEKKIKKNQPSINISKPKIKRKFWNSFTC